MLMSAYKILKVTPDSSLEEIRAAYVRLVRRYPPENFPDRFRKIKAAYDQLTLAESFLDDVNEQVGSMKRTSQFTAMLFSDHVEFPPGEDNLQSLAFDAARPNNQDDLWEFLTKGLAGKIKTLSP